MAVSEGERQWQAFDLFKTNSPVSEAIKNAVFWTCVTRTSRVIGSAPIALWEIDDNEQRVKRVNSGLIASILKEPFPGINMESWMRSVSENIEIYGEAVVYIWRNEQTYKPKFLEMVKQGNAKRILRKNGTFAWSITLNRNDENITKHVDYTDVIHFKGPLWGKLWDPNSAVSPLEYAAAQSLGVADLAYDKMDKENLASILAILSSQGNLEKLSEAYSRGMKKKGIAAFFPSTVKDVKFTRIPNDFTHKTKYLTTFEICSIYGWPPQLLGISWEGASISGPLIPEMKKTVMEFTISPRMRSIEAEMTLRLLPKANNDNKNRAILFSKIPFRLSELEEAQITKMLRAEAGLLTLDEGRQRHGIEPIGGTRGGELVLPAGTPGSGSPESENRD